MSSLLSTMFWSSTLWSLGDFIAQKLENRAKAAAYYPAAGTAPYDYKRTGRLALYAAVVFAPLTLLWFDFLETTFPGEGPIVALKRLSLDQTINALVSNVLMFVIVGMMEGKSVPDIKRKLQNDLWATLKMGWIVWPGIQFVNFSWVPLDKRVLVANMVNIPWCAYLAMKVASSVPPNAAGGAAAAEAATDKQTDANVVVDIRAAPSGGAGGGVAGTTPLTAATADD